ncbi:MAG: Uma2 family endonuclease [Planctomycetes bacterium]|nr:Uma2 family endonuclease [Planctomycetota bacterium]
MGKLSGSALTFEDFLRFPDDGQRYEIIGGQLSVSPAPNLRHQRVLRRIYRAIQRHLDSTGKGEVLWAPLAVVLSPHDIFQPDLMVILPDRASILAPKGIRGAPNLVVEVLSPSTEERDRGSTRDAYDRFGVDEYRIVDPDAERIEVHARAEGRLVEVRAIGRGETFASAILPGLSVRADEVFAE